MPIQLRIPTREELTDITGDSQDRRNAAGAKIEWRFTIDAARDKLKRFYPLRFSAVMH